jgi:hypothetical protein
MIIQPEKTPNKFVVIGPGFQIIVSTYDSYLEYIDKIFLDLKENKIMRFNPADSEENTIFYRSCNEQPSVLNILTEKEFDKLRRNQQYDQARAQGAPGSRVMRNQ